MYLCTQIAEERVQQQFDLEPTESMENPSQNIPNSLQPEVIDLRKVARKLYANRKTFIKPLAIVFVLSCFYILSKPRYYTTDMKLAPETENAGGGVLGSIASSFGFDVNQMNGNDAITPMLYPDLMDDNGFVASLFPIKVTKVEEEEEDCYTTTYYDYMKTRQKQPWWGYIIGWVKSLLPKDDDELSGSGGEFNPYKLSKKDQDLIGAIQKNILLSIDKKTGVISISVTDQDARICKNMADSVAVHLQEYITAYRTNKARIDMNYYKVLADSAKTEYQEAAKAYSRYADANAGSILERYRTKISELQNDVQLKFSTYSAATSQYQAAKAKVQERTPAFTVIKGAAVPVKPAGPKRMIFVAFMMVLTSLIISLYLIKDYIFYER